MPERSGLELLGELGRRALKIPVIFVSGYLNAYRAQIPHHASIEVLEKPVPIEELREVVLRRLGSGAGADASPFSVPDYLQLACLGRHSVVVDVELEGHHLGDVVVCNGEIWSANDERGEGLLALGRLAFASSGGIARCRRLATTPGTRNLDGGWEYLLMEAARVTDEGAESALDGAFDQAFSESGPISAAEPALRPAALPPERNPEALAFEAAWEQGVDALLTKNYRGALGAFTRACALRPDDAKVRANLKRLSELGYSEDNLEKP
jgi:hypothetical protein